VLQDVRIDATLSWTRTFILVLNRPVRRQFMRHRVVRSTTASPCLTVDSNHVTGKRDRIAGRQHQFKIEFGIAVDCDALKVHIAEPKFVAASHLTAE